MPNVGDHAPSFEAKDHRGNLIRLEDFKGKKNIVLFFYPKDFTPGCTKEVCSFRDAFSELEAADTTVIGVSLDDEDSHEQFASKHGLQFPLLADTSRRISKAYGALGMMSGILSMTKRITFVIDKEGIIRNVFRHELAIEKHLDDVRATLRSLQ
ncbi:MAG: peroxiredoxin [Polyangiaceae bacterium]